MDTPDVVAELLAENRRLVGELRRGGSRPVVAAGARGADEIRADLALSMADDDFDAATYRLCEDVAPLLAEVERLREDNERLERHRAVWQANCEDNSAVCDLLQSVIDSLIAERDAARGVVQAVEALHRPNEGGSEDHGWCRECGHGYPCPAVLAASLPEAGCYS